MVALRKERRLRELTQIEVGDLIGRTHSAIQAFEKGTKRPTIQTLRRWCRVLGIPPEAADEWQDDMRAADWSQTIIEDGGSIADAESARRLMRDILASARRRRRR